MGRNLPNIAENPTIIHSFISLFIFIALIIGSTVVITSLCGTLSRKRKKESDADHQSDQNKDSNDELSPPDQSPEKVSSATITPSPTLELDNKNDVSHVHQTDGESSQQLQPLPPPPGRRQLAVAASYHVRLESSSSTNSNTNMDLASSRSMRVLGNNGDHKKNNEKKKDHKHMKLEDSIWKKTIILGDKCKVPDEDEDDPILYDEKGNRISTYHKKNANSMALSRQGSAIDHDALNTILGNQNDDVIIQENIT